MKMKQGEKRERGCLTSEGRTADCRIHRLILQQLLLIVRIVSRRKTFMLVTTTSDTSSSIPTYPLRGIFLSRLRCVIAAPLAPLPAFETLPHCYSEREGERARRSFKGSSPRLTFSEREGERREGDGKAAAAAVEAVQTNSSRKFFGCFGDD